MTQKIVIRDEHIVYFVRTYRMYLLSGYFSLKKKENIFMFH